MTYEEIRNTNKRFLTPEDVREILETAAYSINLQAKEDPSSLLFPIIRIGTRVKIPRYGFLKFCDNVLGLNEGF